MKKRKKKRIRLIVIGALVASLAVLVLFQLNNIKVLTYFLLYSEEEIAEMSANNEQALAAAMNKIPEITLRDLTGEERRKLDAGELSAEEAVRLILGESESAEAPVPGENGNMGDSLPQQSQDAATPLPGQPDSAGREITGENGSSAEALPGEPESRGSGERLAQLLAEIYLLQAKSQNDLENLLSAAVSEYRALPDQERTNAAIFDIGMKYFSIAGGMESESDRRMDGLLAEIRAELNASGGDLSLISDIRSIYNSEKNIRKAEYLMLFDSVR